MCVGTNGASQETNEVNAESKNSRRLANISQLMTEVGEEAAMLVLFPGRERREKQENHIKATAQLKRMKEKIKSPTAGGLQRRAGREIFDYRIKTTAWRETK